MTSILTVKAILEIIDSTEPMMSWLGLFLAAGSPTAFFALAYLSPNPRGDAHPVAISALCGLGTAMAMAANWRFGPQAGSAHLFSFASLLAWFVYLRWYSVRPAHSGTMQLGELLPHFELETVRGARLKSSALRGKWHILIFFRGNWCPFCTAQVTELARNYQRLHDLGAEVMLISSQAQQNNANLAQRFEAPMQFMHDPDNQAARILGLANRWGTPMGFQLFGYPSETAWPTVIIADAEGRVTWIKPADNYRIRPEPEALIEILEANLGP